MQPALSSTGVARVQFDSAMPFVNMYLYVEIACSFLEIT